MRVLFVSTRSPYPLTGGHPLRTFHTLREAARRHEVTLATYIRHHEEWDGLKVLNQFCEQVVALPIPSADNALHFGQKFVQHVVTNQPFVSARYSTLQMRRELRRLLATTPFDLLHLDILPLAAYRPLAPEIPAVLVEHNVEHQLIERRAKLETGVQQLFWREQARRTRHFERWALGSVDRVIAMSAADAAELRKLEESAEVRVVPNGVDTDSIRPSDEPPTSREVLFVGALDFFPNLDGIQWFAKEVWPTVRQTVPDASLTIVGAHPPDSIRLLEKLPGITVAGFVPSVAPYLQRAAVSVVPLRVGSGTRLKLLEAMSAGKAIVSTSIGCEGLEVAHGQELLVADQAHQFAREVIDLLQNPAQAQALGQRAREQAVARYSWELVGQLQERVYQEAVDEHKYRARSPKDIERSRLSTYAPL